MTKIPNSAADLGTRLTNLETEFANFKKIWLENGKDKGTNTFLENFNNSITGLIGINEIATQKNTHLRILWTIFFFLGSAATIFFVYRTAVEYYKHPTGTRVTVDRISYKYPPVLLCTDKFLDVEKMIRLNLSKEAVQYSLGYMDYYSYVGQNLISKSDQIKGRREFLNFYYSRNYVNLDQYFQEIVTDLHWETELSTFSESIISSYYCTGCDQPARPMLIEDSFCYLFPLAPFETDSPSRLPKRISIKIKNPTQIKTSSMWALKIGSTIDFQFPITPVIYVKTGRINFINLQIEKTVALNKSDSPCLEKTTDRNDDEMAENDFVEKCIAACYDQATYDSARCHFAWFTSLANSRPNDTCNVYEKLPRSNRSVLNFLTPSFEPTSIVGKTASECMKKCPNQCERMLYSVTIGSEISLADYDPANFSATAQIANMSALVIELRDNAIYDGGIVTRIEYTTISTIDFISNVGGILGLFIGATIMTFIQLIFFFVGHCVKMCKGRREADE